MVRADNRRRASAVYLLSLESQASDTQPPADNGSGGWNDTQNVFDGSWNRFMDVDAPWAGPVEFGPGNNTKMNSWNLCPGIPHTVIDILRSSDGRMAVRTRA